MIELGKAFSPYWERTPPGMSLRDRLLWYSYRALHCHEWTGVYYNVRVGEGTQLPEIIDDDIARAWRESTQLRIDAVVETKDEVLLVEARAFATKEVLGAALTYRQLWSENPPIDKPFRVVVVTDMITPEILRILKLHDVEVEIV